MTYMGHVENGAIVLDEHVALPDGVAVRIELATEALPDVFDSTPTLAERLAAVIGRAEGLPADWSENHDAYLRDAYSR